MKRLGFTYIHCNDLDKMKSFYSDVLELNRIWQNEESLAYQIGDHQLSIRLQPAMNTPEQAFAIQEGWEGGTSDRPSWSLECDKESFSGIVKRAIEKEIISYFPAPKWVGYWSYPLLDPMNNTLEITCPNKELD
jgi:hypothetical protein